MGGGGVRAERLGGVSHPGVPCKRMAWGQWDGVGCRVLYPTPPCMCPIVRPSIPPLLRLLSAHDRDCIPGPALTLLPPPPFLTPSQHLSILCPDPALVHCPWESAEGGGKGGGDVHRGHWAESHPWDMAPANPPPVRDTTSQQVWGYGGTPRAHLWARGDPTHAGTFPLHPPVNTPSPLTHTAHPRAAVRAATHAHHRPTHAATRMSRHVHTT